MYLLDLDNTLHNASHAAFDGINRGMSEFIVRELGITREQADHLRRSYWLRYGATLLGLVRHHGVNPAHFLQDTHQLPGLEARLHSHPHDLDALRGLPGRRILLTNAPAAYTGRVLRTLGLDRWLDAVLSIEDLRMFGQLRPKPDARMLRRVAVLLGVPPQRCVLVEDTLEHQRSARGVGMRTVWMQRWARQAARQQGASAPAHAQAAARLLKSKPVYVDRRISALRDLFRRR